MSRNITALAIRTGIAPCDWERSGYRHIATAIELIREQDRRDSDRGELVMSG